MRLLIVFIVVSLSICLSTSVKSLDVKIYQQVIQLDCPLTEISNGSGTVVAPGCPPQNPKITSVDPNYGQPIISGLYDAAHGGTIKVTLNGETYTQGLGSNLQTTGNVWVLDLLTLSPRLLPGIYEIQVLHMLGDGAEINDTTQDELTVYNYHIGTPTVARTVWVGGQPKIRGTFDQANSSKLSVNVNGVWYDLGTSPELSTWGGSWLLDLSSLKPSLPVGEYVVVARATGVDSAVVVSSSGVNLMILPINPVNIIKNPLNGPLASTGSSIDKIVTAVVVVAIVSMSSLLFWISRRRYRKG